MRKFLKTIVVFTLGWCAANAVNKKNESKEACKDEYDRLNEDLAETSETANEEATESE